MNALPDAHASRLASLDVLFTRLGGGPPLDPPQGNESAPSSASVPPAELAEATAAPEIRTPEDYRAATEWLRRERARLEGYTKAQMARLAQEHQAALQQNYHNEQALILRSQELSHREEVLQAQNAALQEQHRELMQREQTLAGQLGEWWEISQQLVAMQAANEMTREDTQRLNEIREALNAETSALQQTREAANAELGWLQNAANEARKAREREEAALANRKAWMEQRIAEVERMCTAAVQHEAELDDLEARLRRELEEQEKQLQERFRELERAEANFKSRHNSDGKQSRELQLKLEKRLAQVEMEAERLQRQEAELAAWQESLEQAANEMEMYMQGVTGGVGETEVVPPIQAIPDEQVNLSEPDPGAILAEEDPARYGGDQVPPRWRDVLWNR